MKAEDYGLLDENYFSQINIASNEDTDLVASKALTPSVQSRINLVGKGIIKPKKNKLKKVRKMGKYPDS